VPLGAGARPVHPIRDARLRDLKPELEQFAVDAWRTPKRIRRFLKLINSDKVFGTHRTLG
jgi:hypothetical protein